jgi:hypothetical protein
MILNVGTIKPFPGSPIFDDAVARGLIPDKAVYYGDPRIPYNMTSMPTETFDRLVAEAEKEHLSGLAKGSVIPQLYLVSQPPGTFDEFRRTSLVVLVVCPHCESAADRVLDYPGDIQDIVEGRYDELQEHIDSYRHFVCPECGQQSAFRISRPDLKLHPVFCDAGTIPPYGQLADAG